MRAESSEEKKRMAAGADSEESSEDSDEESGDGDEEAATTPATGRPFLLYIGLGTILLLSLSTGAYVGRRSVSSYSAWKESWEAQQAGRRAAAIDAFRHNCAEVWAPWSPCSASCNPGTKTRTSTVKREPDKNGRPCENRQTLTCNDQVYGYSNVCPDKLSAFAYQPDWTRFSNNTRFLFRDTSGLQKGFHFLVYDSELILPCDQDPACEEKKRQATAAS